MPSLLIASALAAVPVGLWFVAYGLTLLATRPGTPPAAPATEDLGAEPPAVASLLVNHWEITEDAAESTLIDLAARHILEFRQPGNDPRQTTVHVRDPHPAGLTAYEQRVFNRVASLAVGGTIPLTALTFREPSEAATFAKGLRAEVIADARARGLSARRLGAAALTALTVGAAIAAALVATATGYWFGHQQNSNTGQAILTSGIITFGVLTGISGRPHGEKGTAAGHAVAARWLGVRAWLHGHEAFAELPPAAVAVWDRYLSYGAAVGTTRVASAVIDLGMGSRRNVWSSYGGTWHRIRVHYPRVWPRYGRTAPRLIMRAIGAGVLGYLLIRFWHGAVDSGLQIHSAGRADSYVALIQTVGVLAGIGLLVFGGYILLRTIGDLAAPATIEGEVVWQQHWKSIKSGSSDDVALYYLAIDSGGDSTKAWGRPGNLQLTCNDGDTVRATVRRWSRRVTGLTVVQAGAAGSLAASDASSAATAVAALGDTVHRPFGATPHQRHAARAAFAPLPALGPVVTADEVSRVLGVPVTIARSDASGPVETTEFHDSSGKTRLTVTRAAGAFARMMLRARRVGQDLPGLGDEARGDIGWIAFRRGDTVLLLMLDAGSARAVPPATFLDLARSAAARIPATTPA